MKIKNRKRIMWTVILLVLAFTGVMIWYFLDQREKFDELTKGLSDTEAEGKVKATLGILGDAKNGDPKEYIFIIVASLSAMIITALFIGLGKGTPTTILGLFFFLATLGNVIYFSWTNIDSIIDKGNFSNISELRLIVISYAAIGAINVILLLVGFILKVQTKTRQISVRPNPNSQTERQAKQIFEDEII